METKREVNVFRIDKQCEKCDGYMLRDMSVDVDLDESPLRFPHKCHKCGQRATFLEEYHKIVFEVKDAT
jgi:hypothetical protein